MPLTVEVKTRGVGPTASPKLTPPRTSLRNTPSIESISSEPTPEPNTISPPPKPENPPIRPSSSSQEESEEADQTIPPASSSSNDVVTAADADPPSSSFILSPRAALSTCNDASRFTTFTSITPMQVKNVVVPSTTGYVELTATAIGTVKLPIGPGRRLTLPNVLFVPLSPVSVIAGESLWGEKAGVWPGGRLLRGGKGGEGGGGGGGGGGVVVDREGRKRAWFRVVDGK